MVVGEYWRDSSVVAELRIDSYNIEGLNFVISSQGLQRQRSCVMCEWGSNNWGVSMNKGIRCKRTKETQNRTWDTEEIK